MLYAIHNQFNCHMSHLAYFKELLIIGIISFLDKVAVENPSDCVKGSANAWRLCTVTQVEELKSIIRLLPIWATGIVFSAVYSQMGTLFVLQGNTMDLHTGSSFEIPSASLSLFDTISVIFWVPIYDCLIVPLARKFTAIKMVSLNFNG